MTYHRHLSTWVLLAILARLAILIGAGGIAYHLAQKPAHSLVLSLREVAKL